MGGGGVHGVGSGGARGSRYTLGPEMGCRSCPSARVIQGASALALSDPSKMKPPSPPTGCQALAKALGQAGGPRWALGPPGPCGSQRLPTPLP